MQSFIDSEGILNIRVSNDFKFVKSSCPIFNKVCNTSCRFFNFETDNNPYGPSHWIYAVCLFDDKTRGRIFISRARDIAECMSIQKEMQQKYEENK